MLVEEEGVGSYFAAAFGILIDEKIDYTIDGINYAIDAVSYGVKAAGGVLGRPCGYMQEPYESDVQSPTQRRQDFQSRR